MNNNCEITVYVDVPGGELYDQLTSMVKVVEIFKNCHHTIGIVKEGLIEKNIKKATSAVYSVLLNRFHMDPVKAWYTTTEYLDAFTEEYDYAFSYGAPVSFSVIFVDRLIQAKRKFVWIHNDVNQISLDIQKYSSIFKNYERIVCVSKKAKESFLMLLPEYAKRTTVFYNILDRDEILKKSECYEYPDIFGGSKILTVGRICNEKGQDIIPSVTKRLISNGYNVKWFCVGDGDDRAQIEQKIVDLDIESRVILLGNQQNPYPYFKMADIYVQTSRHEGFGITLSEAKLFHLPIITTDFAGAKEQITDGETGFIVPFDEDLIYEKITVLLENSDQKEFFARNLKKDEKKCESSLKDLLD
jgi:glycosyltransferase involved in cell wall biosynthesis